MLPDRSVSSENDQTLTCKIEGISATAAVVWENNGGNIGDTTPNDYDPNNGTWDSYNQEATLLIKALKLQSLGVTSLFTCKVTLGTGVVQSKTMTLTILTYGETLPNSWAKY